MLQPSVECATRSARPDAQVVKLVDTLASGASGGNPVEVQVLSWAPIHINVSLVTRLVAYPEMLESLSA